eukprot:30294-Pelagococcus_subviridis.AAC.20
MASSNPSRDDRSRRARARHDLPRLDNSAARVVRPQPPRCSARPAVTSIGRVHRVRVSFPEDLHRGLVVRGSHRLGVTTTLPAEFLRERFVPGQVRLRRLLEANVSHAHVIPRVLSRRRIHVRHRLASLDPRLVRRRGAPAAEVSCSVPNLHAASVVRLRDRALRPHPRGEVPVLVRGGEPRGVRGRWQAHVRSPAGYRETPENLDRRRRRLRTARPAAEGRKVRFVVQRRRLRRLFQRVHLRQHLHAIGTAARPSLRRRRARPTPARTRTRSPPGAHRCRVRRSTHTAARTVADGGGIPPRTAGDAPTPRRRTDVPGSAGTRNIPALAPPRTHRSRSRRAAPRARVSAASAATARRRRCPRRRPRRRTRGSPTRGPRRTFSSGVLRLAPRTFRGRTPPAALVPGGKTASLPPPPRPWMDPALSVDIRGDDDGDDDVSLEIVVFEEAILSWYEGRVRVSPLARTTTRWRA